MRQIDIKYGHYIYKRYPRDEDDDASASDSKIDEDEESNDAIIRTFASALQETLAYQDCILYMTIKSKKRRRKIHWVKGE
ncbi:hypothetical protein MTR_4g051340 [Medicago truncatula]|uniref:Uncharacterized protein n=1 Tax=Medicago truncatula TaxID=3880 RepID=G7JG24_MEDTR|nr:hypothetical protein MTR_4g051340 [Medicago truncatula]